MNLHNNQFIIIKW